MRYAIILNNPIGFEFGGIYLIIIPIGFGSLFQFHFAILLLGQVQQKWLPKGDWTSMNNGIWSKPVLLSAVY